MMTTEVQEFAGFITLRCIMPGRQSKVALTAPCLKKNFWYT